MISQAKELKDHLFRRSHFFQIEYKIEAVRCLGHYFMVPPRRGEFTKHDAKGRGRARKQASATPSPHSLLNASEDEGDEPLFLAHQIEKAYVSPHVRNSYLTLVISPRSHHAVKCSSLI